MLRAEATPITFNMGGCSVGNYSAALRTAECRAVTPALCPSALAPPNNSLERQEPGLSRASSRRPEPSAQLGIRCLVQRERSDMYCASYCFGLFDMN